MKEQFLEILGFENYLISNKGRVFSKNRNKFCSQHINKYGYFYVDLYNNGKKKKITVHRLVALTFVENLENKETVNSQTTVECTDDQIKRLAEVRMGMAGNCGEFTYWMRQGNRDVQRKGISCQKPDGSWEIVNTSGR